MGYNSGYTSYVKTAISIPDPVFEAAEALAQRLGLSRSGLYAAAVAEFVEAHRGSGVREVLDTIYSEQGSELDLAWTEAQARALVEEDW
jgi:hypothetical protein